MATLSAMPIRTRSEGFALRWTADERDRIKARATEAGMAVGPYLIRCALGEGDPPHLETRLDELEQRIREVEHWLNLDDFPGHEKSPASVDGA